MTTAITTCVQCGNPNPFHRLWCEQCGTNLRYSVAQPELKDPHKIAHRTDLYQKLLYDIEALQAEQGIDNNTRTVITTFYHQKLEHFERDRTEVQRAQTVHQYVEQARRAAQSENYQSAIDSLHKVESLNHGIYPLDAVIAEIRTKQLSAEKLRETARQIACLVKLADQATDRNDFILAKDLLDQANQIDPKSRVIQVAINRHQAKQNLQTRLAVLAAHSRLEGQANTFCIQETTTEETAPDSNQISEKRSPAPSILSVASICEKSTVSPATACDELPSPNQRIIDNLSKWSSIFKPFLLDNVGWFVGAFLIVAGFGVLIVTFWNSIEQNQILMHSFVYAALTGATGLFFATAYFLRTKYPELETSSNVLLVIVTLLIPLVFAAATLTCLVPTAQAELPPTPILGNP